MENRQQQILSEIQSMMASIRNELNLLDAKISEFHQLVETIDNTLEPIALEPVGFLDIIDGEVLEKDSVEEAVAEEAVAEEAAAEEAAAEEDAAEEVAVEEEPAVEAVTEEDDDDLPFFEEESVFAEPEPVVSEPVVPEPVVPEPVEEGPSALVDAMLDKLAWKKDMPGSVVKDVRSAISLNDRILFINKLFDGDPLAFQTDIGKINAMESLPEVVEYLMAEHSDWNLDSDTVYRFMMAVRRKVR